MNFERNENNHDKIDGLVNSLKYNICLTRSKTNCTENDFKLMIETFSEMSEEILKFFDIPNHDISFISNAFEKTKTFETKPTLYNTKTINLLSPGVT